MDKVYIVIAFDGDTDRILEVFRNKDKAEEYARNYEKRQEREFGYRYDSCRVSEYEVIS